MLELRRWISNLIELNRFEFVIILETTTFRNYSNIYVFLCDILIYIYKKINFSSLKIYFIFFYNLL